AQPLHLHEPPALGLGHRAGLRRQHLHPPLGQRRLHVAAPAAAGVHNARGLALAAPEHIVNGMTRTLQERLAILADAAKYDASCASSGSERKSASGGKGLGSTGGSGICHAYAPDGRCISLLKILLTNFCVYDCAYCINRSSSNVE